MQTNNWHTILRDHIPADSYVKHTLLGLEHTNALAMGALKGYNSAVYQFGLQLSQLLSEEPLYVDLNSEMDIDVLLEKWSPYRTKAAQAIDYGALLPDIVVRDPLSHQPFMAISLQPYDELNTEKLVLCRYKQQLLQECLGYEYVYTIFAGVGQQAGAFFILTPDSTITALSEGIYS